MRVGRSRVDRNVKNDVCHIADGEVELLKGEIATRQLTLWVCPARKASHYLSRATLTLI